MLHKSACVGLIIIGFFIGCLYSFFFPEYLTTEELAGENIYKNYDLRDLMMAHRSAFKIDIPEEEIKETAEFFAKNYDRFYGVELNSLEAGYIYGYLTIQLALWRHVCDMLLGEIHLSPTSIGMQELFNSYPSLSYEADLPAANKAAALILDHVNLPKLLPHDRQKQRFASIEEWDSAEVYFKRYKVRLGEHQAAFVQGQRDACLDLAIFALYFYADQEKLKNAHDSLKQSQ